MAEINDRQRATEQLQQRLDQETNSIFISRLHITIDTTPQGTLGSGAFGAVYRANLNGTSVAVKVLHNVLVSEYNMQLVMKEFGIMKRVRHPNIVQFLGAIEPADQEHPPSLVMEALECSLSDLVRVTSRRREGDPENRLTIREWLDVAIDITRGLAHLHAIGIMHRDLKSENVLIDERMRAKVSDLGTAAVVAHSMSTNLVSPNFLAPERLRGDTRYTSKADVYSLGVTMLEMATGEAADVDRRSSHLVSATRSFEGRGDDSSMSLSRSLTSLIRRCVSEEADQRPSSQEALAELERIKEAWRDRYESCGGRRRIVARTTTTAAAAATSSTGGSGTWSSSSTRSGEIEILKSSR